MRSMGMTRMLRCDVTSGNILSCVAQLRLCVFECMYVARLFGLCIGEFILGSWNRAICTLDSTANQKL